MADERTYGSGAGDGENYDPKNVPEGVLERRLQQMEREMQLLKAADGSLKVQSRGRTNTEHKMCDVIAQKIARQSFTVGDICSMLELNPEEAKDFLDHMCMLGCVDCPRDIHNTLGRQQYRLTRQSVVDAVGLLPLG